jgi:molybdopterin/thiamine biosynthesis adenylyltransferase
MRYTQLIKFKEIGEKGHKMMAEKTVSIVGLGNIGSTVAVMLARSGVNLRIIDKGRCEVEDLAGQCLYLEDDSTKFKAKQAKKRLEEINPGVKIRTFHEDLNKNNLYLIESDVVVDATGNPEVSEIISDHARKKKIPMIYALASGSEGIIITSDKGLDLKKVQKLTGKMKPVAEAGLINPAVHMAAALIVKKAFQILLKKPYQKEAVLFNVWTDSIKKQKV